MRLIVSIAALAISVSPALADRHVTEVERAKLAAAVQTEGCTGGKFEMDEDDQQFEVDDATCADGKIRHANAVAEQATGLRFVLDDPAHLCARDRSRISGELPIFCPTCPNSHPAFPARAAKVPDCPEPSPRD